MAEQKGRTKMGEEKAGGAARGKALHTPGLVAQRTDVEPHLRTFDEREELFPRLESLLDELCQTQSFLFRALKNAGLTVVPLDPRARETAPDAAAPALADALEAVYSDMLDRYDSEPDPPSLVRQVRAALRAAGRLASTASAPKEPQEPTPDPEAQRG